VPHIVSLTYVMLNFLPSISKYWKTLLFINKICLIHSRNHLHWSTFLWWSCPLTTSWKGWKRKWRFELYQDIASDRQLLHTGIHFFYCAHLFYAGAWMQGQRSISLSLSILLTCPVFWVTFDEMMRVTNKGLQELLYRVLYF